MFRFRFVVVLVCSFSLLFGPALAQQPVSPPISAQALLQQSLAAQLGNTQISDVTLTGTVRRIAGSDDDTGTATFKALHTGEARIELNLPGGTSTEIVANSPSGLRGEWSGPDRKPHEIANHNLCTDSAWFFPALTLSRALLSPHPSLTYVGEETRNDQAVLHLIVSQQFPGMPSEAAATFQRLSQMDLFLDPSTHLPVALAFNIHPDNNLLLDIPVEIRFSDYRPISENVVAGLQTRSFSSPSVSSPSFSSPSSSSPSVSSPSVSSPSFLRCPFLLRPLPRKFPSTSKNFSTTLSISTSNSNPSPLIPA